MTLIYYLLLGALCVWRITHLLQVEDGPWNIIVRIRGAAGSGFLGKVLDCFYCLSLWIALPLAWILGQTFTDKALLWPALSGAAILLERATRERDVEHADDPGSATFFEDPAH